MAGADGIYRRRVFKAISLWLAIIGFILVAGAAFLLASLPDIIRYGKINSM